MHRRVLLSLAGTLLTGCTGTGPPGGSDSRSTVAATSGTRTPRTSPIGRPGSEAPDGLFSAVDRIVSYRRSPDAALALVPSTRSASLPTDLSATVHNRTGRRVGINPYHWMLHKHVAGTWAHIVPGLIPLPLNHLHPGDSHTWSFSLSSSTDPADLTLHGDYLANEGGGAINGLGGGEYALTTVVTGDGTEYGLLARISLDGPEISLEPTGAALYPTRRDGRVTVTVPGVAGDESTPTDVLTLERGVSAPSKPVVLPAERAVRDWRFRNSLPFFEEGVSTVRLRAKDGSGVTPPFGIHEPQYRQYEGETYRLTTERGGSES